MTNEELTCWLKGYVTLNDNHIVIKKREMHIIKNHLDLVKTVEGFWTKENALLYETLTHMLAQDTDTDPHIHHIARLLLDISRN